jgi:DNA-binding transcriptional LysR family regulator
MEQSAEKQQYSGHSRLPVLDSELLKTFVAIAETGSFARAAKFVFRTPSAVSMQMKRLEDVLNSALFLREGRSVSLTSEGESLLSYARRILQLHDEAVAQFVCPTMAGTVRIGTPDDFAVRFLPNILTRFSRSHPKVQVEVHSDSSKKLVGMATEGKLDMTLFTPGCSISSNVESTVVFEESLAWIGLEGGDAYVRRPVPLAVSETDCPWRSMALAEMDKVDTPYRIAYSSAQTSGQEAAVLADLAIAALPASLAKTPYRVLGPKEGLPVLGRYQIGFMRSPSAKGQIFDDLEEQICDSFYTVN